MRKGGNRMSRVCAITGKGPLTGNRRSHSMRASRRTWNVNLQKVKVMVDGKELKTTDYTVKEGSTIVTLNAAYLETLSVGKHTLEIESKNGIAKTEFTITAPSKGQQASACFSFVRHTKKTADAVHERSAENALFFFSFGQG